MSAAAIISFLGIPADARVDQRVAKKLLVENGAPTASDKRQINDGIEDLIWVAALKPVNIGMPAYKDDLREYLEIAVLHVNFRPEAKASRLKELIHRAIPYPVFLIQSQVADSQLSLAHLRWSQGQAGQTVLDGSVISASLSEGSAATDAFLASLNLTAQPRQNLHALYQGWVETFEAHAGPRSIPAGSFPPPMPPAQSAAVWLWRSMSASPARWRDFALVLPRKSS
jgi:Domain of unknown function (DUF4391)